MVGFICSVAYASPSDIGLPSLWNRVFNSEENSIEVKVMPEEGTVRSGITTDSYASGDQPITADTIYCTEVTIKPLVTNLSPVYVGGTSTTSLANFVLTGDDFVIIHTNEVGNIHFRSDNNADGVSWIANGVAVY